MYVHAYTHVYAYVCESGCCMYVSMCMYALTYIPTKSYIHT